MTLIGGQDTGLGNVDTAGQPGGEGGAGGTLAEIYTAGLADPLVDNLFPMPSGNLRFQGDAFPPAVGYYEPTSTPATFAPAEFMRLYADLAASIGGRGFMGFGMWDPTWDGTYPALADFAWQTEIVTFTSSASETWDPSPTLDVARRYYQVLTDEQPLQWPNVSGFHSATHLSHEFYSYIDDAALVVEDLSSLGQVTYELTSVEPGLVGQFVTKWRAEVDRTAEDGDGVSWIVTGGEDTGIAAMLSATWSDVLTDNFAWETWHRSGGTLARSASWALAGSSIFSPLSLGGGASFELFDLEVPGTATLTLGAANAPAVTSTTPTNFFVVEEGGQKYITPLWPIS